jgi:Ala-tRNA(Pro) deacylase
MRVPFFLTEQQVPYETLLHPPAFTAQKRAHYLHVPGRLLAKSVLLAGPRDYLLAVLPATHRVDTAAVGRELGGAFRLADNREMAEVFRDCEWGALAPFGTLYGLSTILDDAIDAEAWIVFEAQVHAVAIRMRCRDFERLERPRRFHFARRNPEMNPRMKANDSHFPE